MTFTKRSKSEDVKRSALISCAVCGEENRRTFDLRAFDYAKFIQGNCQLNSIYHVDSISWESLMKLNDKCIVDCRPTEQHNIIRFIGTDEVVHLPLNDIHANNAGFISSTLRSKFTNFNAESNVYVFCRSGITSITAVQILCGLGIKAVNITDGLVGYKAYSEVEFNPLN